MIDISRRLGATAGLLGLIIGVPLLLLETSGAPGLGTLPDLEGLRRAIDLRWIPVEWAIRILSLFAWALWVYLVLAILLRIAGAIEARSAEAGRLRAASEAFTWAPVKLLVDLSLGAVLLSGTVGHDVTRATARPSGWSGAAASQVAAIRSDVASPLDPGGVRPSERGVVGRQHNRVRMAANGDYVVRPGDSLWSIAERELKDPYRWKEIWHLNEGRAMPDGERLSRPGFVRPGWRLRLPTIAENGHARDRCNEGGTASREAARSSTRGNPLREPAERAPKAEREPATDVPAPPSDEHPRPNQHDRVELPSGTAVAVGFVAGLVTAIGLKELRARWRRAPRPLSRGWPRAPGGQSLKSRLLRRMGRDIEAGATKEEVEGILRHWKPDSNAILLGHREVSPVLAASRGQVYGFAGETKDIHAYFRDLLLSALVSNPAAIEPWTTPQFGDAKLKSVRVFEDVRGLVSELEIEVIKRHRLLDEEDVADWSAHQDAWPDDPLPLLMTVLPQCEEPLGNRLSAIAAQGQDLGIFVFREDQANGAIVVKGKTLLPVGAAMKELLGDDPFDAIKIAEVDRSEVLAGLVSPPPQAQGQGDTESLQIAPPKATPGYSGPPFKVSLFGSPEIIGVEEGEPDGFGAKSREFLYFFLLHPQGATREQAMEALWPETDVAKGVDRFWFQMRTVRSHFRNDAAPTAKFIDKSGDAYRPSPELFDVDVWDFDRLIADAAAGKDVRRTLSTVGDLYRGDLLEGVYFAWAEPLQSHFRKQFIDAMVQLSRICSADVDYEAAADALAKAIAVDRYAEHLYRSMMALYAKLGRRNDVERVYKELEAALSDGLEAEPDPETHALKNRLLTQELPSS